MKNGKLLAMGLFLLSIVFITSGIVIDKLKSPTNIVIESLNKLDQSLIFDSENKKDIFNDYTLNSNIKIKATSKYLEENNDVENVKYKNLLNNISNLDNYITIRESNYDKQLLFKINSTLNNNVVLNNKYLIDDATNYFYNEFINDNYINMGANNYFIFNKKIEEEQNILQNIIDIITPKNIIEEESNNKDKEFNKLSIKIDNASLIKIIDNYIIYLYKDSEIKEFVKASLNNKYKATKQILNKNQYIYLNIYTDKSKYKINNIELNYNNIDLVFYSDNMNGYIKKDKNIIIKYNIEQNEDVTNIKIKNNREEDIGILTINKEDLNKNIRLNLNYENYNINYNYNKILNKNNNMKKIDKKSLFRIIKDKKELININTTIETNISNKAEIYEDLSTLIFKSSLKKEEINNLLHYDDIFIKRLYEK